MRIFFLIAVIALVHSSAMAHNPLTAKFELNSNLPKGALLSIYLSQTGVHEALIQYYPNTNFAEVSTDEYKKMLVQYLKEHIAIKADDTLLAIGEGGIKLGNHQTDLKFLIENYPDKVHTLEVKINAFKENDSHHSAFWWKRAEGKSKVILSAANNFRGTIGVQAISLSAIPSFLQARQLWLIAGLGALILFLSFYSIRRIRKVAPSYEAA